MPAAIRHPLCSLLAALLLGALAGPAAAGTGCELQLQDADARLQEGKLGEARQAAEACLAASPSRQEKILAQELLAKVHLAEDDLAQARHAVEEVLRSKPDFAANPVTDPPRFVRLVDQVRRESSTVQVSSVSKTPESLREAPATVMVVTAAEIESRGYVDLEAVLHDLPGFDISRTNGLAYSNIYQRGYRSDLTTRTLFLVDGVEQNEIWTQAAYLSRQYPLSNIDRIEVIYGPASTMYGANAFAGVINVITKEPESLLKPKQTIGARLSAGGGSFDTRFTDSVLAGQTANGGVSWSLTGRTYASDEMDLSKYPDWQYDPAVFDSVLSAGTYQKNLGITDGKAAQDFLLKHPGPSPYYTVVETDGKPRIQLTAAGAQRARDLDKAGYLTVDGHSPAFSDSTRDGSLYGKLKLANLELGFETWRQAEGANPWYTERALAGGQDRLLWIPEQTSFYAKYGRSLNDQLSLSFFSRYRLDELGDPTSQRGLVSYSRGRLGLADLVDGKASSWAPTYFFLTNTQLQNELSLVYLKSEKLNLVGGLEVRNTSLQGNYVTSATPNPQETGKDPAIAGGNRFNVIDAGAYLQASYRPWERFKVVAGGRVDYNKVRDGGYGAVFNPRLAAVWSPGAWVFKAIYAEAFQDASAFQKFVATDTTLANPDLQPEKVKNVELSAGWQPAESFQAGISAYQAEYSDVVQLQDVSVTASGAVLRQFRGAGAFRIRGLQADASWKVRGLTLTGNYTFTDPRNEQLGRRVGDIASHQANLALTAPLIHRLSLNLRANFIGEKRTGAGTDVPTNPLTSIGSVVLAHAALTYKDLVPHTSLQLAVSNLFDKQYSVPGIRQADGLVFAPSIPQPGRTVSLRLTTRF
jgi:outer membrane receptor for ferrienterochelin and colicin